MRLSARKIMSKFKEFMSKRWVRSTILITVAFLVIIAFVIINIFIPVKYFSAFFSCKAPKPAEGEMRVTVLDVGYGDCAVIELPDGKNMLIDGGDGELPNGLAIQTILNKYDINRLDYVVCTSVKEEHCGGLFEILRPQNMSIGTVFMPNVSAENAEITPEFKSLYNLVQSKAEKQNIKFCKVGEGASGEKFDYFFTFITPPADAELIKESTEDEIDNFSASVWLQYGETSMLFTGDVQDTALESLVQSYNANPDRFSFNGKAVDLTSCDILKVGYHGAVEAKCAPYYNLLQPSIAVISNTVAQNGGKPAIDKGVVSDIRQSVEEENLYVTGVNKHITLSLYEKTFKVA